MKSIGDPVHIFSLIPPHRPVLRVDLGFGDERVAGILDTGAQRSLISTTCYERIQGQAPPLMQPLAGRIE